MAAFKSAIFNNGLIIVILGAGRQRMRGAAGGTSLFREFRFAHYTGSNRFNAGEQLRPSLKKGALDKLLI